MSSETICLHNCIYRAPISYEEGKVWCALKGAYVELGRKCEDYKEKKG